MEKLREQLNLQAQDGNSTGSARILDLKTGTVKKDGHTSGTRLSKHEIHKNRIKKNEISFQLVPNDPSSVVFELVQPIHSNRLIRLHSSVQMFYAVVIVHLSVHPMMVNSMKWCISMVIFEI